VVIFEERGLYKNCKDREAQQTKTEWEVLKREMRAKRLSQGKLNGKEKMFVSNPLIEGNKKENKPSRDNSLNRLFQGKNKCIASHGKKSLKAFMCLQEEETLVPLLSSKGKGNQQGKGRIFGPVAEHCRMGHGENWGERIIHELLTPAKVHFSFASRV